VEDLQPDADGADRRDRRRGGRARLDRAALGGRGRRLDAEEREAAGDEQGAGREQRRGLARAAQRGAKLAARLARGDVAVGRGARPALGVVGLEQVALDVLAGRRARLAVLDEVRPRAEDEVLRGLLGEPQLERELRVR
jgi:hypothetical protein